MEKVTNERLKELADPNTICKCSWDEYKSISAELLANREAQPVAWTDREELAFRNDMACMWTKGMGINEVPLYTAPPSPAVPPEKQHPDVNEFGGDPYYEPYITECGQVDGWNACRAAMLEIPNHDRP